jgi:hypothetical protein
MGEPTASGAIPCAGARLHSKRSSSFIGAANAVCVWDISATGTPWSARACDLDALKLRVHRLPADIQLAPLGQQSSNAASLEVSRADGPQFPPA